MKDGDWECPFRITGMRRRFGYGLDVIQSLTATLEKIRITLDKSDLRLSWITTEPGDKGFERCLPRLMVQSSPRELIKIIDLGIARFTKTMGRRKVWVIFSSVLELKVMMIKLLQNN